LNYICRLLVMHLNDVVLNLFKPSIHEALHTVGTMRLQRPCCRPPVNRTPATRLELDLDLCPSGTSLGQTPSLAVGSRPCIGLWQRARPRPRPRHNSSGLGRRKKIMSRSR
jgi:hypothetical protein